MHHPLQSLTPVKTSESQSSHGLLLYSKFPFFDPIAFYSQDWPSRVSWVSRSRRRRSAWLVTVYWSLFSFKKSRKCVSLIEIKYWHRIWREWVRERVEHEHTHMRQRRLKISSPDLKWTFRPNPLRDITSISFLSFLVAFMNRKPKDRLYDFLSRSHLLIYEWKRIL